MVDYYRSALFAVLRDSKTYLLSPSSLSESERSEKSKWFTKLTGVKAQSISMAEWDELLKQHPQCSELVEFADRSWKINKIK